MIIGDERYFDDARLNVLFKEHFIALCAQCQYTFNFSLDTAKEVVHTGFIKLWDNRHTITSDPAAKAYLHTVVTNTARDMLRHEKVKLKHFKFVSGGDTPTAENTAFNVPDLHNLSFEIEKAIGELPLQMRRVFELSRYEGLKYREIAERLEISIKTVETQMSRALSKLRERLSDYRTLILLASLVSNNFSTIFVGVIVHFFVIH